MGEGPLPGDAGNQTWGGEREAVCADVGLRCSTPELDVTLYTRLTSTEKTRFRK